MKSEHLIHMKAKFERLKFEMKIAKAESERLRSKRQKTKFERLKSEMKIAKAKSKRQDPKSKRRSLNALNLK